MADDNTVTFEEADETRVVGVGVGTFLVIMFFIIGVLVFVLGTAGGRPVTGFVAGATVFGLVTALLFAAERDSRYVETEEQNAEYSSFALARWFLVMFMALSSMVACCGWCVNFAYKPVHVPVLDDGTHVHSRRRAF